jgi:hypothetical protein
MYMKVKVITSVIVLQLLLGNALMAQNTLSLAAGLNYSSVSSINSSNPDGKLGFNAGIAYKRYIGDLGWFVKPGFSYSQEGWLLQRIDYINLPVISGFDFTDDFNFNLGFQYGYLVGGLNDPQNRIDRSNLAFLVGFEFYPTEIFDVGLRFANGIKNIVAKPDEMVIKDARTYSIQFYFGFNLGKKGKSVD